MIEIVRGIIDPKKIDFISVMRQQKSHKINDEIDGCNYIGNKSTNEKQ